MYTTCKQFQESVFGKSGNFFLIIKIREKVYDVKKIEKPIRTYTSGFYFKGNCKKIPFFFLFFCFLRFCGKECLEEKACESREKDFSKESVEERSGGGGGRRFLKYAFSF